MAGRVLKSVREVAEWRLCTGCGACAYACPEKKIHLVDAVLDGIRPVLEPGHCKDCSECLKVCPGYETTHYFSSDQPGLIPDVRQGWGPTLEIWEGYASDQEIRYRGSSGGIASALALYCVEREGMHGVLHAGPDPEIAWRNQTHLSKNREDLLSRTGSRYGPASPCNALSSIEISPGSCVFIGKGCDVAGLRKAERMRPVLCGKVGLVIGIFCAGTPATMGTLDLIKRMELEPLKVKRIRYRGEGWPGMFVAGFNGEGLTARLSYKESWAFLQKFRPFRCYLCPDGTSEFADISCGDPWYRKADEGGEGYSLVLARTEKGRAILRAAMEAGYISLWPSTVSNLEESQRNLLEKRSAIWGRLFSMRMLGIPIPRLEGFSLFRNWRSLSSGQKVRSVVGTVRRIVQRKYFRPVPKQLFHEAFPLENP